MWSPTLRLCQNVSYCSGIPAVRSSPVKPQRSIAVLALSAATALVLAGCGGKTTDTGSGGQKQADVSVSSATDIAALVPDNIRSKGTITIGTDASYPPNEFSSDGGKTFQGMDIDLGNAIGKTLNLKVKFVNAPFDGLLAGLAAGKYDMSMSSFTDNAEREKTVDFVTYYKAGTSIAVKKGNPNKVEGQEDLCGLRVAAEKGTTQLDTLTKKTFDDGTPTLAGTCAKDGKKAPVPVALPDQNAVNAALIAGRADAFIADSPVAEYQVKQTNGGLELGGEATDVAPYGIAIPKGSGTYKDAVQKAVKKLIDDGTYGKILDTWGLKDGGITEPVINGAGG
jgi:polar amino acid transport system substrate-binding protein